MINGNIEEGKKEEKNKENKFLRFLGKIEEKAKEIVSIVGLSILITVGGVKCADTVVQPPVIEIKDANEDVGIKDVKNEDAKNDVEDIKNIEDIKDDIEDIKDAGADDISDIGEDADTGEDVIDVSDIKDVDQDDIKDVEDSGDITPINYDCEVIKKDLDGNEIKMIYNYFDSSDKPLSCEISMTDINKISITFVGDEVIQEKKHVMPFDLSKRGVRFCLPRSDSCTYEVDENNNFSKGVELEFQLITNELDPNKSIKIIAVIPRIKAYLDRTQPFNPDYTNVDYALYALTGTSDAFGGVGGYIVFANHQENPGIMIYNGQAYCGTDINCGKQYKIQTADENGKKHDALISSIWKCGAVFQENQSIISPCPILFYNEYNTQGDPLKIGGAGWKVTKMDVEERPSDDDTGRTMYIVKGFVIEKL